MSDDDVTDEEFEVEEEPDADFDDDVELAVEDDELDDPEAEPEDLVDPVVDLVPEEPPVPARRKVSGEEDEEDEEELDPDDVEADLDTILKDRIASGDDLEDDEEEVTPDRNDPEATEGVSAKREGEFTCELCFMIVHPRQFGRAPNLTCPEGYENCPSIRLISGAR